MKQGGFSMKKMMLCVVLAAGIAAVSYAAEAKGSCKCCAEKTECCKTCKCCAEKADCCKTCKCCTEKADCCKKDAEKKCCGKTQECCSSCKADEKNLKK